MTTKIELTQDEYNIIYIIVETAIKEKDDYLYNNVDLNTLEGFLIKLKSL